MKALITPSFLSFFSFFLVLDDFNFVPLVRIGVSFCCLRRFIVLLLLSSYIIIVIDNIILIIIIIIMVIITIITLQNIIRIILNSITIIL